MSAQDLFRLDGRVVFLSGAAGHLGREMALALGHAGATLILNGRNLARLEAFAAELARSGIESECASFDMMDFDTVRRFFAARPRLDILINNAVTMTPKSFADVTPADFDSAHRSAVTASFEAIRAARPALTRAAAKWGDASVINVATMYASVSPDPKLYSSPDQMSPPHYGAAKAGLVQLTRHLAAELGPEGVRVNALSPGPFPTDETTSRDPAFAGRLAARTMLGRTGRAAEIGGPVLFLASPASSFVTGAVVTTDGGWTAW
ncbi:MAG TPA: SDR family oxidoreductase [Micropepsaceae bacterium]|nr:SDR family oxidoreductase [Micropepsaceae bacterium]